MPMKTEHCDNSGRDNPARQMTYRARDTARLAVKAAVFCHEVSSAEQGVLLALVDGAVFLPREGSLMNGQPHSLVAAVAGVSVSTAYRRISAMAKRGLLRVRTGTRGQRGLAHGVCLGIDLGPLLHRADELGEARLARIRDLQALEAERRLLTQLKGELRQIANGCAEGLERFVSDAARMLADVPRRYAGLDRGTIGALIDRLSAFLTEIFGSSGRAKTPDQSCSVERPHTDTDEESINRTTDEKGQSGNAAMTMIRQHAGRGLTTQMIEPLLPPQWRDAVNTYGTDEPARWMALCEVAGALWMADGRDMRALEHAKASIGPRDASILAFTVLARARNPAGAVGNADHYLIGCARRARDGAYDWVRGLASARRFSAAA